RRRKIKPVTTQAEILHANLLSLLHERCKLRLLRAVADRAYVSVFMHAKQGTGRNSRRSGNISASRPERTDRSDPKVTTKCSVILSQGQCAAPAAGRFAGTRRF